RSTTDEGEAQEREGFRLSKPAQFAIVRSKAAELSQARLVRVERQCKFPKPVVHRIKEATCVALMLKADHQIVGISPRRSCRPGPPAVSSAQPKGRSSNAGRYWRGSAKSPSLGRFPCHRPSRSRLRGCPPAAISGSGG